MLLPGHAHASPSSAWPPVAACHRWAPTARRGRSQGSISGATGHGAVPLPAPPARRGRSPVLRVPRVEPTPGAGPGGEGRAVRPRRRWSERDCRRPSRTADRRRLTIDGIHPCLSRAPGGRRGSGANPARGAPMHGTCPVEARGAPYRVLQTGHGRRQLPAHLRPGEDADAEPARERRLRRPSRDGPSSVRGHPAPVAGRSRDRPRRARIARDHRGRRRSGPGRGCRPDRGGDD